MSRDIRGEYDHEHCDRIMRRFLERGIEGDIYRNVTLEGDRKHQRAILGAYLGFYAHVVDSFRLGQIGGRPIGLAPTLDRILQYRFTKEQIEQQDVRVICRRPPNKSIDPALWVVAKYETRPLGLPTAFFLFDSTLDGKPEVSIWYPRAVPGHWMLAQLQQAARR
jgi:hypothetical protein